jgi:hypothetical protein
MAAPIGVSPWVVKVGGTQDCTPVKSERTCTGEGDDAYFDALGRKRIGIELVPKQSEPLVQFANRLPAHGA